MNKIRKSILIATMLISAGCQNTKEIIREVPGPAAPSTANQQPADGTIDSGGGNGYQGRPLESYRIDAQALPEVKNTIESLLVNLSKAHRPLASEMLHILRERAWYLLPGDLNKIPGFKLGTYFPTDQIALQNLNEIWIDSRQFDKMKEEDRITLLVHELLMGVRILEWSSSLDICLATAAGELFETDGERLLKEKRKKCFQEERQNPSLPGSGSDVLRIGQRLPLDHRDYALIRWLTNELVSSGSEFDGEELEDWLEANAFRAKR